MAGARSNNSKINSNTCFLPEELVLKILTFLPVLSLLRCKSVCKTWLSIILNPQFIQTHLIESHKKQPSSVLYMVNKSIYVHTCENSTLLCVLDFLNWWEIEVVCSCNGLVCVSDLDGDCMYLGNPMTRRFKKLPPRVLLYCDELVLGFGFHDISNDYKILRILQVHDDDDDDDDDDSVILTPRAEMYSANDNSWKQIHIPKTLECISVEPTCVNLKGSRVLYFKGAHELLSFDLHTEVFRVYHYPISYPIPLPPIKSFVLDFEGSVALICNESTEDKPVLSLWTLNQVLGNWSRTKEFNLDDSLDEFQVTNLHLGDGQFFACGVGGAHIFYDYKKKHVKKVLDHAPLLVWNPTEYTETLVSLKGFEQLE